MTNDTWDQRCRRCGRCCYEKIEHDGRIYYTDVPCKHLDLKTGCCRIYSERHRLQPECMPLTSESLSQGILPEDCPYVADIVNYNKPQLLDEDVD
jgi:uncharacterized cysteine cluster protein YcgN (CxxCxxCC family)